MINDIRIWTFTFGVSHPMFSNRYVSIAGTYEAARALMTEVFGTNWAFQYPTEKDAGVHEYHLKQLTWKKPGL